MKTIAIDIGGTHVKWAVLDKDLKIIENGKFESLAFEIKTKGIFKNVANKIIELKRKYNNDVDGVAISLPGIINSKTTKIMVETNNLPESKGLIVKEEMKKYFDLPIVAMNDANAAALGEMTNGEMKGYKSGILITIGTGIGMGIIINGKIYEGPFYSAGEVGRQNIDGRMWEHSSSTRTLINSTKLFLGINDLMGEEALNLTKEDKIINEIFNKWIDSLSVGISNLINVLDPEIVVLGGGISENNIFDIETIKNKITLYLNNNTKTNEVKIVKSSTGNNAPLYGVTKFFRDRNKK